jgi:hypothetical protein
MIDTVVAVNSIKITNKNSQVFFDNKQLVTIHTPVDDKKNKIE